MSLPRVTDVPTEHQLLAAARRGDASALGALYEAHGGMLLRLGVRITGSASDAEDLLHDLFVGLPELLGRYEHRAVLGAWLRGVMTRMALGRLRQGNRRDAIAGANALVSRTEGHPWDAIDLERSIALLGDGERAVFVLRQEGYAHEEIARLLGISSGASRVRHLRALKQLRATLEPIP